jgi:hypothetical protein
MGFMIESGDCLPVLMLLKAIPMSPSDVSVTKEDETLLASSTAWVLTVVPPMVTVSVPTTPLAPDPSAYSMLQVYPESAL